MTMYVYVQCSDRTILVRVCFSPFVIPQEVGWRDGSLRIVMVLTDAGFKTALDGRVNIMMSCVVPQSFLLSYP